MRVTGIFLLLSYFSVISQSYTKYSSTAVTYPKTKGLLMSQSNLERADLLHQVASMAEKIEMLSRENAQLRISAASPPANFYAIEYPPFPAWYEDIKSSSDYSVVDEVVREWNDENWRLSEGGFSGTDFVHSRSRAPVRVLEYLIIHRSSVGREPSTDLNDGLFYPSLVGPAYFSPAAESHKGLCHGGSMCALMDDAIGWMGFCISGRPKEWTGFTVQVNAAHALLVYIFTKKYHLCDRQ